MSQGSADNLIKALFADEITPEAAQMINEWVREDPANARLLAEFIMLDGLLLVDQKNTDATAILASLLEAEQSTAPLTLDDLLEKSSSDSNAFRPENEPITLRNLFSLAGYIAVEGVRKPAVLKGMIGAAAVLLLGATLTLLLLIGPDSPEPTAGEERPNTALEKQAPPVVAALTAEHDAVWDRRPGKELRAGQRFSLIQGLAEITTRDGATAVIEAPATIDLLRNDNAVYLRAGKLVGRCETPSSKGFVVRTPHGVITDVGTEFAVAVSEPGGSEVHVIEGRVAYSSAESNAKAMLLDKGQAVLLGGDKEARSIGFAPTKFVTGRALVSLQDNSLSAYERSLAIREERARMGGVVLDLKFDKDAAGRVRATSLAPHDGALVVNVSGLVPGRFGERTAVRLADDRHFIQATIGKPMKAVTVTGWYYIESFEHAFASMFHSTYTDQEDGAGNLHWHIERDSDGTAEVGLYQHLGGKMEDTDLQSPRLTQSTLTGRWVHLAVTLDTESGEANLYLDGRQVASVNKDKWLPVVLGEVQVGNWRIDGRSPVEGGETRALRGAVDEFAIFDHAMTSQDIRDLYQSSRF